MVGGARSIALYDACTPSSGNTLIFLCITWAWQVGSCGRWVWLVSVASFIILVFLSTTWAWQVGVIGGCG